METTETNVDVKESKDLKPEELLAELEALRASKQRVEEESKKYKKNWQELRLEAEERQKKFLEEQGKFKELYEVERKKNDDMFKNFVKTKVQQSVSSVAQKFGCVSVDALLKLGNADYLQYDEATGNVIGVETFVEEAKKTNPFLFSGSVRNNVNPNMPTMTQEKPFSLNRESFSKLSTTDKRSLLSQVLKGK
jgi:hypothetical protein